MSPSREGTDTQERTAAAAAGEIRAFLAVYNSRDVSAREVALRVRELLHKEIYRRERDLAEFIDLGGEG